MAKIVSSGGLQPLGRNVPHLCCVRFFSWHLGSSHNAASFYRLQTKRPAGSTVRGCWCHWICPALKNFNNVAQLLPFENRPSSLCSCFMGTFASDLENCQELLPSQCELPPPRLGSGAVRIPASAPVPGMRYQQSYLCRWADCLLRARVVRDSGWTCLMSWFYTMFCLSV